MIENKGVAPVEPPVEDEEEEETGTRTTAKPEPIKNIDASEGQKPVDDWADSHR
ncbi:MAG: hypothetical protein QG639_926 [Patescibacteria group bacterium]|nr:hypothetical protein [Patescibacteria group bacterium]